MKTRILATCCLFPIEVLIRIFWLLVGITCVVVFSSCALTRSKTPEGGAFTSVSVLENAEEKTTSFDPATGYVTVTTTGQNQTEGAKVIASGIVSLKTIEATADFMLKRLGKEQAIETATIEAGSQIDTLREANRSAEALKALEMVPVQ